MNTARLHIHRWHNDYVVSRGHPAPERVRDDLDRLVVRLSDELTRALDTGFDAGTDGVVLIRHLGFDCELDAGADSARLAARWASGFVRALVDAVDSGEGVLRFPSAAAYRARFIADLLAGGAWQAWYYRPFAGLQVLPAAAAIRTVLLEDVALGRDTLAALAASAWPMLASTLTRREAMRILTALAPPSASCDDDVSLLKPLVARSGLAATGATAPVQALAVLAAGLRAGLAPTGALADWARLAGYLLELSASGDDATLMAALLRGELPRSSTAGAQAAGAAWCVLAAHPDWQRPVAEVFAPLAAGAAEAPGARLPGAHERTSEFAGLALLLPELDDLLDARLTEALPCAHGGRARSLAAWLALAHCAGRSRAARFVRDGFWREFFAVAPQFGFPEIIGWLHGTDAAPALAVLAERAQTRADGTVVPAPEARCTRADWRYLYVDWGLPRPWRRLFSLLAQLAMRRFGCRIPGTAASSLPYLYANFLAGPGRCEEAGQLQLTRPPLHILLNLSGIARRHLYWPGPPPRRLVPEYLL